MLRSVLHVHQRKFRANFEALDVAIQALRYLTCDMPCPSLIRGIQVAADNAKEDAAKTALMNEAIAVMEDAGISDRSKLRTLESLLVPAIMSMAKFRKHIYYTSEYPFALAPEKDRQIKAWLREFYALEISCNQKHTA